MVGTIRLSACIAVEDDAQDLSACLESCGTLAQEIVLLDRRESPKRGLPDSIRSVPVDAGDLRGAAELAELHTGGEWVLLLSADERLSEDLRRKIDGLLSQERISEFRAFDIRRRHWVCGRPMGSMNLQPDYPRRLFERQPDGSEFQPKKPLGRLEQPIEHTVVSKLDLWLQRRERVFRDQEPIRTSGWRMALRPPARFLQEFIGRGGWRDRRSGLIWAGLQASAEFLALFSHWQRGIAEIRRPRNS